MRSFARMTDNPNGKDKGQSDFHQFYGGFFIHVLQLTADVVGIEPCLRICCNDVHDNDLVLLALVWVDGGDFRIELVDCDPFNLDIRPNLVDH